MGSEFTLLRFDATIEVGSIVRAAGERKVPLKVLDVSAPPQMAREACLVLSRPDQHVAWRGHSAPADPLSLIDRIRGAT